MSLKNTVVPITSADILALLKFSHRENVGTNGHSLLLLTSAIIYPLAKDTQPLDT